MKRIVIVVGHARTDTFCEALAKSYLRGAEAAGHDVTLFVTSRMHFDPILHEGYARLQPLEPDLQAAHTALAAGDHIVLIFPLWVGMLPAIFKGFLERIFQAELIEGSRAGRFLKPWAGKSARVMMTMGMPGLIYRWYYGAHALKALRRNVLEFVGVSSVRSTIHGMVEAVSLQHRAKWLTDAEAMGRRAG